MPSGAIPADLPEPVRAGLAAFSAAAQRALGEDLVALVLFGSAAEGRLRPTSDVNLVVVLSRYEPEGLAAIGEAYRLAQAAIRLSAMFILESEIASAGEAFAVKFADIAARHAVIHGHDVFAGLVLSRVASLHRLRQVLLNLLLRSRERYVASSAFPERLALAAADAVGPLRASAATLLQLESGATPAPRDALRRIADETGRAAALAALEEARLTGAVPGIGAAAALLGAAELTSALLERVGRLAP
jgi:predicted nucleotidyltransferase